MNTILLLTGTINTQGISFMQRNNIDVRRNDYEQAINMWLKDPKLKIVFVENSNFCEKNLNVNGGQNFEYITFDGQDFPREKGKGYGEIRAIEYALNNSKLIKSAQNIIKCNGRYFFNNIHKLIDSNFDLVCNLQRDLKYSDSRVFYFNKLFFKNYLVKFKNVVDDSNQIHFEHVLARAAHLMLSENGTWSYIPFPLIIQGFSGTGGFKINTPRSFIMAWQKYIRNRFA